MTADLPFIITLSTSVFVFLVQFAGIIWRISKVESCIMERVAEVEKDIELDVQEVRKQLLETKLEISNTYVRKDSLQHIKDDIVFRLNKFEDKLDSLITTVHGSKKI